MNTSIAYIAIAVIAVLIIGYVHLYRRYRRNIRKVSFMFDAIDNVDFSFKFPTTDVSRDDKLINTSLNRIKLILERARDEAVEREKYYERIINSVDTGIIVVDERGNVLQQNDAALRLIGISVLTHVDHLKRVSDDLRKHIMNILPGEKRHVTYNNERGEVSLSLRAAQTVLKGRSVRLIAISDINSELDDNELDSWIKLIRVLTHEIMNTVTPITSLSETLLHKSDGEIHHGLEVINKTSNELIAFVDNYRKFSHVPTPVPTLFYVKPFIERMQQLTGQQTAGRKITITTDINPDDLIVYADESLIGHVVTNIMKNAVQAVDDGGNISVRAYCDDKEAVIIDITNDGPMIPEDVARHIFVPFFTTKKDGSGIGLSISKQIMHLSGGTMALKTDKRNGFTTFRLIFP